MHDVLGRRLRFAPPNPVRLRRRANGTVEEIAHQFIKITERDILLFEAINRHGPLPVHYLHEFTRHQAHSLAGLKRKITKLRNGTLYAGPYLDRPDQQFASIDGHFQANIYDLTPRSLAVLAERGARLNHRGDPFLHRLMTACVTGSLQLAAERHGLIYGDFAAILAHPKCPQATPRSANPLAIPAGGKHVIPDSLFVVQGERPFFYAVEIDRRTESINSETARTAYGRKLQGYLDILANRTYRAHFGIPNLYILTVTTNPLHLQHMLDFYHSLNAAEYARQFLFKSIPYFAANWHVPPVMYDLFNEPWLAADGSRVQVG